jgi:hypothetical protein
MMAERRDDEDVELAAQRHGVEPAEPARGARPAPPSARTATDAST